MNVKEIGNDIRAVWKRGWKFIVGSSVISALGATGQVLAGVHNQHGWHLPSAWWLLVLVLAWVFSAHLVLRDRGRQLDEAIKARDLARREPVRHIHEHSWVATQPNIQPRYQTPPPPVATVGTPGVAALDALARNLSAEYPESEIKQQNDVLERLWRAYTEQNPSARSMTRRELPKAWTDRRLDELGHTWRRERYEL